MWFLAKLLFGLGRLRSALTAAWGWATKNPAWALCGLFLATTVWFWHGKSEAKADAAIQRAGWVAEVKLRIGDHARYRAAQIEAERLAREAKAKTEARYAELAREADNAKLETLRAAADSFGRLRTRKSAAVVSASGATVAAAEGDAAPDRDGPGSETILLTRPEYDQFVSNTLRLEAVRRWGDSLISEGLAVPAP